MPTLLTASQYSPLPSNDDSGGGEAYLQRGPSRRACYDIATTIKFFLALSFVLNVVLVAVHVQFSVPPKRIGIPFPQLIYSPAQDVLHSEPVVFHSGFEGGLTLYDQPPSPEVDEAWDDLYRYSLSKISHSQASMLPNKTYSAPSAEGKYMVALDVFHQLHCLNQIRKVIYSDYYPGAAQSKDTPHMRHCLSSLRQSLMCSGDTSAVVWEFQGSIISPHFNIAHMCRDFETIKHWAQEHHYEDFREDLGVDQL